MAAQPKLPATFRKHVLALLGESYGDKTLVLCPTVFVRLLDGDHIAAILLSQILYWSDRTKDPDGWFYKRYADWKLETGLSETQVRRIVNGDARTKSSHITLRDLGVETLLRKVKRTGAPTLHYRVNQTQFLAALHAFMGQGDPQHCAGSMPEKAQVEPSALPGMHSEQSAGSLILPEITTPENTTTDQDHLNPAHHPDEDDDLEIYRTFTDRFGLIKTSLQAPLRAEQARLGVERVGEVLERCASRGRSWAYVVKALANETAAPVFQETGAETRCGGGLALDSEEGPVQPNEPERTQVPVSERLQTPWQQLGSAKTVLDAWSAAFQQLEFQLDRGSFDTFLRGARLVDFEPETRTFVVLARNTQARDMLQYRFKRMVERILSDVYGQRVEGRFVLAGEWEEDRGRAARAEQIA